MSNACSLDDQVCVVITIKISNIDAVVEKNKGWFVANVVGAFVDLESRVEDIVIAKLREALSSEGIEAEIQRVAP
jgi:hypothetical protein